MRRLTTLFVLLAALPALADEPMQPLRPIDSAVAGQQATQPAPAAQPAAKPAAPATSPAAKPAAQPASTPAASGNLPQMSFMSDKATFAFSRERVLPEGDILWPGFLNGMRGFEHFYEPVGNPLYFESPFINTQAKILYLWHKFPRGSQIGGGDLSVFALQARIALTDRLAFIATKDGYSVLNAGILPPSHGWNDAAVGFKYAAIVDRESDFVLTPAIRWEWENGGRSVLQGQDQELAPSLSFAKGWDQFHLLGNLAGRFPMDGNDGNYILHWDLHLDYEVAPEALPGFAPMLEFHGVHYLSDGDRLPLGVGGLDYTNLGSEHVAGNSVYSAGIGFRWKLTPHLSVGSVWEFPLSDPDNDIMGSRVTADVSLTW
ncbi:MAG: hypothetical protein U1D55_16250 [Phycisphaerae bacterium]